MGLGGFGILGSIFLLVLTFVWLLPVILIVRSNKTTGGEKLAWVLAVLFVSWFAWIFYLLLAPLKMKEAVRS